MIKNGRLLFWTLGAGILLAAPACAANTNTFYLRGIATELVGYDTIRATETPAGNTPAIRSIQCTQGAADDLVYSFISPAIGTTTLSSGTWNFTLFGSGSKGLVGKEAFKVYVYSHAIDGTETLIFTVPDTTAFRNNTTINTYTMSYSQPTATTVNTTDRLVVKVYVAQCCGGTKAAGDSITLYYDSSNRNGNAAPPFDIVASSAVSTLGGSSPGVGQVTLTWKSTGNDGSLNALGAGSAFYIQYATYTPNWNAASAQTVISLNTSVNVGTNESQTISNLIGGQSYNFAEFTADESGNVGGVSNIAVVVPNIPATPTLNAPTFSNVFVASATAQWADAANPAGTIYNLLASTAPDFSGAILSSSTANKSAVVSGLNPGTSYYFQVDAVIGLSSSTFLSLASTTTIPDGLTLAIPTFSEVDITSVTVQWTDPHNPANTLYALVASTASNYTGNITSATTSNTSLALTGLNGRTTYYFEVQASANGATGSFTALGSTTTRVIPPGAAAAAFSSVFVTSAVVQWTSGGNGAGTLYTLQASTAPDFSGATRSSSTANTSATVTGLSTSTAYFFQVDAIVTGASSTYVSLGSTVTLPAIPVGFGSSTFTLVGISSITAQWGADGNGPAVLYELQASSVAGFSGTAIVSSITANTSAAVKGLLGGTTYYLQVRARTGGVTEFVNLGSTATLQNPALPPGTMTPSFTNVTESSITAQWTDGGNSAGTTYTLQTSTVTNVLGVMVSSATGGQGSGITASAGPLSGNTTYYVQVRAAVGGGTAVTVLGSTMTLPAMPGAASLAFPMIGVSSISVQWSVNGNSTWTVFDVQTSTASDFTGALSSAAVSTALSTLGGLAINSTYYFEVRARGNGKSTGFFNLGSVITYPAPPLSIASTFTAVYMTSATVQWSANGNGAGVTYGVQASNDPNFGGFVSSGATAGTSITLSSLSGFTTYYFRVNALAGGYAGSFTSLGSTRTLPVPPVALPPTFTDVEISSVTARWSDPNNGPGIQYTFQCSTASNFTGNLISSTTANQSATLLNLSSNTLYNCEVQSLGAGSRSVFVVVDSTQTLVPPPGLAAPTFTMVSVTSATVQWSSGGNAPGTIYTLVASDRSDFNSSLAAVYVTSATASLSATATPLFANTTVYFEVEATGANGANSAYEFLGSTITLPPAASAGNSFYLRNLASDLSGFNVLMATQTPTSGTDSTAAANTSGAGDVLIAQFVTPAVGTTTLLSGTWTFGIWGNTSNSTSNSSLKAIVNIQHVGGTITQYLSSLYGAVLATSKKFYTWTAVASAASVSPADRLSVSLYSSSASGKTQKSGYTTTIDFDSTAASSSVKMPFDIVSPDPVTTLNGATGGVGQANLNWTATGDDGPYGSLGAGAFYFVDYSTYAAAWNITDPQVVDVPINGASPGSAQNTTIGGLVGGTTYYFGMWTQDEAGNLSAVSNTTFAVAGRPSLPGAGTPPISQVFISSFTAQWTGGGNPAGTRFNLQASTAPDFSGIVLSSSTTGTSATVGGLTGGTTYFVEVDAVIGLSSSVYLSLGSTATLSAHASIAEASIAPPFGNNGRKNALISFVVKPAAEAGNGATWSGLRVQLMDQNLNPLTNAQAGTIISSMSLIANSLASYTTSFYNFNIDTEVVANVNSFSLDGIGRQMLVVSTTPLPGSGLSTIAANRVYFLAVQWAANAAAQTPNTLRVAVQPSADITMVDPITNKSIVVDTAGSVTSSSCTAIAPAAIPTTSSLGTSTTAVQASPAFNNAGTGMYAGSAANQLVSLNSSGGIAWTFQTSSAVLTSPTDNFEGTVDMVYFADAGGTIYKVQDNGTSAAQVWSRTIPSLANIVVAPALAGTTLFMAAPDGKVYSMNYLNGNDNSGWSYSTTGAGSFTATPYIDVFTTGINSIFIGGQGGQMYRLAVSDGSQASVNNSNTSTIYASPNLDSGLAFAASNSNVLYWGADDGVIRARTSANLSSVPSGWADFTVSPFAAIRSSPFLNRNENPRGLYFGCNNGKVYKINAATGAEIWEYQTNGNVTTTPIVLPASFTGAAADYVYWGSDDGMVYGVTAANGTLRSGFPVVLGGGVRAGPIYDSGTQTITVGSMDGRVVRIQVN